MKMLAPRGNAQALIELVHQPGLAPPHRPPQVNPGNRRATLVQALKAALQGLYRPALGVVGHKTLLVDGVLVGGERRVESHACQYDLQRDIQP